MKSLDLDFLNMQALPIEMGGLLQKLGEFKGRQDLFRHQSPQILETLKQTAVIESTESSNRIEGITLPAKRFKELMARPEKPKDRSEAEILGYRQALSKIHTRPESFMVNEETILALHRQIYERTDVPAGQWKKRDNPFYMKRLCADFNRLMNKRTISPLIIIPAFIFEFLCIHPFADGNGRVSRLLTVLLLHQEDFTVGRYISLERLIEESKETYYEALALSSKNWHSGKHSLKPWWEYFLGILIVAYQNFEQRVGAITKTKGTKTAIVEEAVENLANEFKISDIERICVSVSRDMIRVVLNRLRDEGAIICKGTGRNAIWQKRGNEIVKRGNKRSKV